MCTHSNCMEDNLSKLLTCLLQANSDKLSPWLSVPTNATVFQHFCLKNSGGEQRFPLFRSASIPHTQEQLLTNGQADPLLDSINLVAADIYYSKSRQLVWSCERFCSLIGATRYQVPEVDGFGPNPTPHPMLPDLFSPSRSWNGNRIGMGFGIMRSAAVHKQQP